MTEVEIEHPSSPPSAGCVLGRSHHGVVSLIAPSPSAFSSALGCESGAARVDVFRSFSENRSRHHTETSRQRRHSHMSAAAVGAAAGAAPAPGVARVSGMRKCARMASRFPAAVCPLRAVPSTGAWAPSPAHRRHADDAARRLSVRAASSKASKVGRFPPTPATDAHPLVEHGVDLGELCARWRAEAGKPGATVLREVQTMLRGGDARRRLTRDCLAGSLRDVTDGDASDGRGWRLLLSHKNENLYNAFALEVAALAPGSTGLTTGLFALPAPLPEPTLMRMASVRATIDPLACAESADALAAAVRALNVGDSLGATPVALYHDCVARHPARVPSPELYDAVGKEMASWGGGSSTASTPGSRTPTTLTLYAARARRSGSASRRPPRGTSSGCARTRRRASTPKRTGRASPTTTARGHSRPSPPSP